MRLARALATAFGLTLGSLPALAGPTWTTGYGQGTAEAMVTGASGRDLNVSCSAGGLDPVASIFFMNGPDFAGQTGQHYVVEFKVDDKSMTLVMALSQPTVLAYEGREAVTFVALGTLAKLLQGGKSLTVVSRQLQWEESFPLKGSGKALTGIFEGCAPAN